MRKSSLKAGLFMIGISFFFCHNAIIEGQGVWFFDEGQGQVVGDSSPNRNDGYMGDLPDGTTYNATWDGKGKFGKCISFNNPNRGPADQCVTIPNSLSLNITANTLTLEAWVNPGIDLGPGVGPLEYMSIMNKGSYGITFNRDQGGTISGVAKSGDTWNDVKTVVSWKAGEWHHIAMSYDGKENRLYIDGVLKDTVVASGKVDDSSDKSLIIGASYQMHWGWTGKIDEVRVLNRALSAPEIEHDAKFSLRELDVNKVTHSFPKNKGEEVKPKSTSVPLKANPLSAICSFETQEDINKWKTGEGVILVQSTENATDGKYSAKVTFLPNKTDYYVGLGFMDGNGFTSRDWSKYAMLAFDVYNPNRFGIHLMLTIRDSKHTNIWKNSWHEAISWEPLGIPGMSDNPSPTIKYSGWKLPWEDPITTNRTTIRIPLLEPVRFMASQKSWKAKISDVENFTIELFTSDVKKSMGTGNWQGNTDKEITFFLDNVRFLTREEAEPYLWTRVEMGAQSRTPLTKESPPVSQKKPGVDIDIPFIPFFEDISVQTKFTNLESEEDGVILEASLDEEDKNIITFPRKEIICPAGKEVVEKHTFDVKDVRPGRYNLSVSLLKGDKIVHQKKKLIRIYGSYVPIADRDFNYVLQEGRLAVGYPDAFHDADVFRYAWGPARITYPWPVSLEKFVEHQMPFVICEGLFDPWQIQDAPYELARERARGIVKEADKIGGKYFHGVWLGEVGDGTICRSQAVAEAETRLGKADAYVKVIKQYKEDFLGLNSDKIFMNGSYYVSNQALDAEAGTNVILKESGGTPATLTSQMALTRGIARSFKRRYGDVIASDGIHGDSQHFRGITLHYDIKTGRYDPNATKKVEPPVRWTWSLEDVYKMFIERYYNGINYLMSSNEHPLQSGDMVFNFFDFIKENPRCKDIVSSVAIMESKGNYMGTLQSLSAEEAAAKNNSYEIFGLWKWLYPDNIPYKEEMDFIYLNSFFPNLTDDNVLYKHWWTGTPYGAVDRIYPVIKLEDMKKYNALVFLGYHRMDSVRKDFLDDLMKYVEEGGIVILAADQMKDSKEEFNQNELKSFVGVSIAPAPKLKIKDYIQVVEATPFKIKKERYPIASEVKFKGEKEPWVYKVTSQGAKVIAVDSQNIPVLFSNNYGKGHIFFFTSPTLSMIPPVGKSPFISDVIDKVCRYKPLPVMLSPENENVEYLITRTEDREATIFIMNHGEKAWEGDIRVDLARSGLSPNVGERVTAKVCQGYKVQEASPEVIRDGDNLVIKGIKVEGDTSEPASYNYLPWLKPYSEQLELKTFCSYRQASFALVRVEE